MGQLICRPRIGSDRQSVLEQPCVLLSVNPITEEDHLQRLNELVDDEEAGREDRRRKKKRGWRWHSKSKTYNIAKAEKLYQSTVARTNWRRIDDLQEAPISSSEVVFTAEAQLDQEVLQPAVLNMLVSPSADDSPVSLSADGNIDSAESPTVYESCVSAVNSTAHNNIDCAVSPTADMGIDAAKRPKVDGDSDCAGCPKVDEDIDCAELPTEMQNKNCISCWYTLVEELGKGGFGLVYKGIRIKDGLKVAVKFVRKTPTTKYSRIPFYSKRLPLEIALAVIANRAPSCPNIIQVLDWHDNPENYVMVMEHPSPSVDLHGFLKLNGGVLKEHITQNIMRQVIYAASICCYRGVFHGDIKLKNLVINLDTLEVKLIDFGCAKVIKDSAFKSLRGTIPYIPPEYYDTGSYHAKPATVFSLGVLLFTMVHGRYPTAQDQNDLMNRDWSRFDVSQECCHFIQSCLQRDPKYRLLLDHMHCHDWLLLRLP